MSANVVTVTSVVGTWSNTTQDGTGSGSVFGQGTSVISWGQPTNQQLNNPDLKQSQYIFTPNTTPISTTAESPFIFGTLTHENWTIFAPSLLTAQLNLTIGFEIDGVEQTPLSASYLFTHNETPNSSPCGFSSTSVCDDIVTFAPIASSFGTIDVNGTLFTFVLDNFQNPLGTNVSAFQTLEANSNQAFLVGRWTSEVPIVPLPAAAWLMLAGIGGLGLMARRRSDAA